MELKTSLKLLKKYEEDETIQNFIAQANSRYILYNAQEPIENFPHYTLNLDEKCLHIAFSYLNLGWSFFFHNKKDKSVFCIEKAAGIIEHLFAYKDCQKTYSEFYGLVCGLSYYVSSQYSKSFIVLKYYTSDTHLSQLFKCFLTRNFTKLEGILKDLQFSRHEDSGETEIELYIYIKIFADALLQMMIFINTGNQESIEKAESILYDLIELAKINEEPHMWWIFRLFYLVIEEYKESSLWSILPNIINDHALLTKYVHANLYKKNSVVELFKSQRQCVLNSMDENDGFAVGMPTSSGKTKIAEISMIKTLSNHPNALCIYIAPFRSLANEIEQSLASVLNAMNFTVSNLYGSSQSTRIDRQIISEANVIIATPEKIKSILRSNVELEERIKLVVLDEGHLVGFQPRYIASELLIEEIKIILKKNNGNLILLSAVLPNLADFAEWVTGDKERVSQSSWRPSSQRFGELEFINNTVHLKWEGEPISFNNNFIESTLVRPSRKTKTGKNYKAVFFPNDKKEASGATAVKMLSMGSVLIFVGKTTMVLSQARVVSKLFLENEIIHEWKNIDDLKYVELACEEAYGENSEIYSLIKQGIVCHSSKLATDVRQSIERLISNGSPKIIVATSTLGQGVNVGVSTVIVSNVYFDQDNYVDVKDFWNIAGRAGRAFTDTEGKILFVIDRNKDSYFIEKQVSLKESYFEQDNVEKAISGIYRLLGKLLRISKECGIDYNTFLELLSENRGCADDETVEKFFQETDHLLDLLDDTLLAMNIKNDVQDLEECSNWIDEVFMASLAYLQAQRYKPSSEHKVIEMIKARNKGVVKLAGPSSSWMSIACSSVPFKGSLFIDSQIEAVVELVGDYVCSPRDFDDLISLIQKLDCFVETIPIAIAEELVDLAKNIPIRNGWYAGKSVSEIEELDDKALEVCTKYYGFHFPWIINAISKKMNLLGFLVEAEILENISLFSEIGVPNIESAKIYLAGIKSRECAIELSSLIDFNDEMGGTIKNKLIDLLSSVNRRKSKCSDKAHRWLELLNKYNGLEHIHLIEKFVIRIKYHKTENYSDLHLSSFNKKLYLCSHDYKIILKIKDDKQSKYESLAIFRGVLFQRTSNDLWELKSHNPYVRIIES